MLTALDVRQELSMLADAPGEVGEGIFLSSLNRAMTEIADALPILRPLSITAALPHETVADGRFFYRLDTLAADYLNLLALPDTAGLEVRGTAFLADPSALPVTLIYRKRPLRVTSDTLSAPLDLRADAETALIYRVAALVLSAMGHPRADAVDAESAAALLAAKRHSPAAANR